MKHNQLAAETSPYLLQHKDNPVHWMAWGNDALSLAITENKPILLSVGYAACHWCHVMAHESFENDEIANLMNKLFINIKVDREERPDLDAIYQNAISALGQQGGWPLTVFLTPKAIPFWGGTYYPPISKWGRPGFGDIIQGISNAYKEKPQEIEKNSGPLMERLKQLSLPKSGNIANIDQLNQITAYLENQLDHENGGFGQAPKFPQPMIMQQLQNAKLRTGAEKYSQALKITLNGLCKGGIYDHLGGGFSRYSVDARWLVPHFEKMLYDNAQLISLLTNIWVDTKDPLYKKRVAETINWTLRDLTIKEGAFTSSLDADSEGVEGKFYVWTIEEIDELLGADAKLFKKVYDITADGNWEGNCILNQLLFDGALSNDEINQLENSKAILLKIRNTRIPPTRDDKILADWNGLMIKALVQAGDIFNKPQWIDAAKSCFDFIIKNMSIKGDLYHSWCNGKAGASGLLEDYANMMGAAISLYEVSNDSAYLMWAEKWAIYLDEYFRDNGDGAFFTTKKDTLDLIVNQKTAADNAVPSGNGLLLGVYIKLYLITGKEIYQTRAEEIIHNFSGELDHNFYPLSSLLNNTEFFLKPLQIIIIGEDEDAKILRQTVNNLPFMDRLLLNIANTKNLPDNHPAHSKTKTKGKATAYICEGPVCSLPITDKQILIERLQNH